MKLINKIFLLFMASGSFLMAKDEVDTKQVIGSDVAIINIFWNDFSKNRDDIFLDHYLFSITEDANFFIVKCDLNVELLKNQYKKTHPNANMTYLTIKGGCGWGKISKNDKKIVEKKYYK